MTGIVQWVALNGSALLSIILALLGVAISIALLVPGEEPENSLQKVAEFLAKFSKK